MTRGIRVAWLCMCAAVAAALLAAPTVAAGARVTAELRFGGTPQAAADAAHLSGLAPDALIHFTVALKPRSGLTAFARQVSDPSSPLYRAYLTPAEFGRRFGATKAQLDAVEASLRAHGLSPGSVSANRLSIPVTANVGAVERAFSLSLRRVWLQNGRIAVVPSVAPAVDARIANDLQAIVGLTSVSAPRPLVERPRAIRPGSAPSNPHAVRHVATGGPQPCSSASSTAASNGAYTADQIASAYRFSGLYGAGDQGQGQTIAIYELEPNDPQDIAAYQSCYGTSTRVSYVPVDGGAGSGPGAGEAALDIEQVIGLAPKATILVYHGPNSGSGTPGSGPYDTFSAIVNQNRAHVITTSWGACESSNGTAASNAESNLFEQAAAEGQAVFAASGDTGSEDCITPAGTPTAALAVDDPGSQPFVTSVGGTTLSSLGPAPTEKVWNGGGSAAALAGVSTGSTGGGISQMWQMPGYQAGAAGTLNVVGPVSSGSPCGASQGFCRQVPDVSASADPAAGYVVYWNGSGGSVGSTGGWQVEGGTSASSPLWGALMALVNGSSACRGSAIGFANPALYKVAGSAYAANFNDVSSGNNDYTGTNSGRYAAGPGYDMATGLGTPNAASLASALCPAAFRVLNPGRLLTSVNQRVSVQVATNDDRGGISYRARALPPGLSINSATGRITGKPRKAGTYSPAVIAVNRDDAVSATSFAWQVVARPSLKNVSLTGLGGSRPRLQLKVTTARGAPGLKSLVLEAPPGLTFPPGHGRVTAHGPGGRSVDIRSVVHARRLQVLFLRAQGHVTVVIGSGAIARSSRLLARGRGGRPVVVAFKLLATDSNGLRTTLRVRVKSGP